VRGPDGKRLGETPLTLPAPQAPWTVTLSHPGYAPAQATLAPQDRGDVEVTLAARPTTKKPHAKATSKRPRKATKRPRKATKRRRKAPSVDLMNLE